MEVAWPTQPEQRSRPSIPGERIAKWFAEEAINTRKDYFCGKTFSIGDGYHLIITTRQTVLGGIVVNASVRYDRSIDQELLDTGASELTESEETDIDSKSNRISGFSWSSLEAWKFRRSKGRWNEKTLQRLGWRLYAWARSIRKINGAQRALESRIEDMTDNGFDTHEFSVIVRREGLTDVYHAMDTETVVRIWGMLNRYKDILRYPQWR